MKRTNRLLRAAEATKKCIASKWFWRIAIGLFVLEATYIALVGRYSMAFDEYYHFGAIQAYAKAWFPWQIQQPDGPTIYGALTADPSYLYHYLMSLPFRLIALFTDNQTAQIVALRLVDVLFVVVGLYVFRKLLLRLGMARWATHLSLVFITLLPVASFLAGQLAYDTLFFLMSAVTFYAMVWLVQRMQSTNTLPLAPALVVLSFLFLTSQIKYAFLPIALVVGLFFLVLIASKIRSKQLSISSTVYLWRASATTWLGAASIGLLIISASLFVVRYGSNTIKYHSPIPACDAVISREECQSFGPYQRDDSNRQNQNDQLLTATNKVGYPIRWFNQMVRETYFTVGPLEANYPTGNPLPVPYVVGYIVAVGTFLLLVLRARYLWRFGVAERLLLLSFGAYAGVLFLMNYQTYLDTGVAVAIHGRYLLPLFPVMAYLVYRAIGGWVLSTKMNAVLTLAAAGIVVFTAYGGGIAPFVLRSDSSWYLQKAVPLSRDVRNVTSPFIWR